MVTSDRFDLPRVAATDDIPARCQQSDQVEANNKPKPPSPDGELEIFFILLDFLYSFLIIYLLSDPHLLCSAYSAWIWFFSSLRFEVLPETLD